MHRIDKLSGGPKSENQKSTIQSIKFEDEKTNHERSFHKQSIAQRIDLTKKEFEYTQQEGHILTEKLDGALTKIKLPIEAVLLKVFNCKIKLAFILCLMSTGIFMIYYSLKPIFYGINFMSLVFSIGSGLLIFLTIEILFYFLEKTIKQTYFDSINVIVAIIITAFLIHGFVGISKARFIVIEIEAAQALMPDSSNESLLLKIETAKKELFRISKSAMVLLFIGFEWISGVAFYLASQKMSQLAPIAKIHKKLERCIKKEKRLTLQLSRLEMETPDIIIQKQKTSKQRTQGLFQKFVAVIVLATIMTVLGWAFAYADGSCETRHILVALDVTDITEQDHRANISFVESIIGSLNPGDAFQLALITDQTFKKPIIVLNKRMPFKAGHFKEYLKRAKFDLIHRFRKTADSFPRQMPATCLIDGLFLFTEMLSTYPKMEKILIIISDFKENSPHIRLSQAVVQTNDINQLTHRKNIYENIPDMRGITAYALGASTRGLETSAWLRIKSFWKAYFNMAGAEMVVYTLERPWPLFSLKE